MAEPASRSEAVGLIALSGFVGLAYALPVLRPMDAWAASLALVIRDYASFSEVKWLTRGAPYVAAILVLLGVGVARWRGAGRTAVLRVLAQFAIGLLFLEGVKLSFMRWRPGGLPVHPVPDSFPSGHVANAALCAVAAIELVRAAMPAPRLMKILSACGGVFVVAVASTRLYFELHWLTDIVASLLLGVAFAAFVAAYRVGVGRRASIAVVALLPLLYVVPLCGLRVWLASPDAASTAVSSLSNVSRRVVQAGDGAGWLSALRRRRPAGTGPFGPVRPGPWSPPRGLK